LVIHYLCIEFKTQKNMRKEKTLMFIIFLILANISLYFFVRLANTELPLDKNIITFAVAFLKPATLFFTITFYAGLLFCLLDAKTTRRIRSPTEHNNF
jgi:hypothetical protein